MVIDTSDSALTTPDPIQPFFASTCGVTFSEFGPDEERYYHSQLMARRLRYIGFTITGALHGIRLNPAHIRTG
jgi:hypothetical protein